MKKRWQYFEIFDHLENRGLVDAPMRSFNQNEQEKIYEELTTNVNFLLSLRDVVKSLTDWGFNVRILRNTNGKLDESPQEMNKVDVVIDEKLDGTLAVDILIPNAYLDTAVRRGYDFGIPIPKDGIMSNQVEIDINKLIAYSITVQKITDEHRDWLNEEIDEKE